VRTLKDGFQAPCEGSTGAVGGWGGCEAVRATERSGRMEGA
jgi:hypothetical protein